MEEVSSSSGSTIKGMMVAFPRNPNTTPVVDQGRKVVNARIEIIARLYI